MNSKMIGKVIGAVICVIFATTALAGCKAGDKPKQISGETSMQTGKAEEGVSSRPEMIGNMYKEGLPIVKEKVTFDVAIIKIPLDKAATGEKEIVKEMENETNVAINWIDIPQTAWNEKINIMFTSGDLPDMIIPERGGLDIMKWRNALTPLNDLLPLYGPVFDKFFQENPSVKKLVTTPDGKIYSIPRGQSTSTMGEDMWINNTWLQKLGLQMPQNPDELYEVLKAFKTMDPNGNTQKDEIPVLYANSLSAFGTLNNIISRFGISDYPEHIGVKNGKAYFVPAQPGYLEALKFMNKLQKEGLLDPEGLTQNDQQMNAKGAAGIAGLILHRYAPFVTGGEVAKNYVAMPPIKGFNGQNPVIRGYDTTGTYTNAGFVITKKCETPEILVRWLNAAFATQEKGMAWILGPVGDIYDILPGSEFKWKKNEMHMNNKVPGFASSAEYQYTKYVPYMMLDLWNFYRANDTSGDPFMEMLNDSVKAYEPYKDKEFLPKGYELPENADERNLLQVDIENYLKSFLAKSILDGIDDKAWDEHLNKLKTLKVDRYVELYQQFIETVNNLN